MLNKLKAKKFRNPPSVQSWDEEVIFDDGDRFFADLIQYLGKARQTIELETYIFSAGALGDRIAAALRDASQRGVCVRILVDGWGSPGFWTSYGSSLAAAGVEVHLYRTLPWQVGWMKKPWFLQLAEAVRRVMRVNSGNHRKFCLIDSEVAWIGSYNISDVHLSEIHGQKAWLDTGVRVRGHELRVLTEAFNRTFSGELFHLPMLRKSPLVILNSSFILRRTTKHQQIRRLKKAKRKIWIQTPYFVPIRPMFRALIRRARSGVDVRLIIPATNDVPIVRLLSYAFFSKLLKAGVKIYEFAPRFSHQKILQVDDWASIGSSNMNHRSFLHDLELDVVIRDPINLDFLREKFLNEEGQSKQITLESLRHSSIWSRSVSYVLLAVRYWS